MADTEAFEVGKNLAVTPGKVVYENELMQLIQYAPGTDTVFRCPLLVVPPWMNKFYVMDLRPENSMVKWLVDQGHTVFMISWINPGANLAHKGFEDYMLEGPIAALEAIEQATGEAEVHVMGYCLGGSCLLRPGHGLRPRDERIRSGTFLTAMVDFSDVGDVSLFINPETLSELDQTIHAQGFLDGQTIADTFGALRANDLVWSFFVNGYLLGKRPKAFDILYWNVDTTNMPAAMHTFFMRNMYLGNLLREPGGISLAGISIDVRSIRSPTYVLSTREDHIAPWKSTYETVGLVAGDCRFVLGASGHIAGVINPPASQKYSYWTNEANPSEASDWLAGAAAHEGSWWSDWQRWVCLQGAERVAARQPGDGALPVLEDAPGRFVKMSAADC